MKTLKEKIANRLPGIVTYGFTPPKRQYSPEKIDEIVARQISRINSLPIDGLILYDIQDEINRITAERPFPFLPTIDPFVYSETYLKTVKVPKIVYRSVGQYDRNQMTDWLNYTKASDNYSVFVGVSADNQEVKMDLAGCYALRKEINPQLHLGGVVIPERHLHFNNEHDRVKWKTEQGCSFFISQIVYHVEAAKNFLSDLYYMYEENNMPMVPIIITLAPCGSLKTLEFIKWLGLSLPKWLENDLQKSQDILHKSVDMSISIFKELLDYSMDKKIPLGCNVESLAIRKDEIEASVYLVDEVKKMFDGKGIS
jgi:hypothetical protein